MNNDLVPQEIKELTVEERNQVEKYKSGIDFSKPDQIVVYGAPAQSRMATFADSVLNNVRSKDMGEVGQLLSGLVTDIRSFDSAVSEPKGLSKFFSSLTKRVRNMQAQYSKVETNVNAIMVQLDKHSKTLSKDIFIFNEQYKENWDYFREISLYIAAGEEKIKEMNEKILPELKKEVDASGSQIDIQKYNDLQQQVVRFEKKVHDLKLSRMISAQLAPQIRLVQNNSITMVDKIQSTIVNTLPLWKNQMVLALGIAHTKQALSAQKKVTDATNELLRKNSEMLKQSTTQIATESERGIVDMDTIKKANSDLFEAMDDLMRIQKEGRQQRIAAEIELKAAEEELKQKLLAGKNI